AIHAHDERFCDGVLSRLAPATRERLEALLRPAANESSDPPSDQFPATAPALLLRLRSDPGRPSLAGVQSGNPLERIANTGHLGRRSEAASGECRSIRAIRALVHRNDEMKKALITDVDNTLFDWVDIWYRSFTAMLYKIEEITGIPEEELYLPISKIHQEYGTSEYAFLLEEIPVLRERYGARAAEELVPAIDAFRAARRDALCLYPGVMSSLKKLKANGITTVAYTESMSFYTNYRFRKLELDTVIDYLYSPPDHRLPYEDMIALRKYPHESYLLKQTVHRHTPQGEKKPNPHILSCILSDIGGRPDEAVYVGDHPKKDVAMAQQAGVLDVLASYGAAQHREQYELLKKVTHWTREEVEEEKAMLAGVKVSPTVVIERFDQILSQFDLVDLRLSDERVGTQ